MEKKVKKIFIYLLFIVGILFISGCDKGISNGNDEVDSQFEMIPDSFYAYSKDSCTFDSELYFENNNYNYYKVCIDYIEVSFKDTKLVRNLDETISNQEVTLNQLLDSAKNKTIFEDFNIYHYGSFNLAIRNYEILLIDSKINYEDYLLEKYTSIGL